MEACVDRLGLCPSDHVLEIGFGLGFSAARIQTYSPASHTIIECAAAVQERCEKFCDSHPGTRLIRGMWQTAALMPHAFSAGAFMSLQRSTPHCVAFTIDVSCR